MEIEAEFSRDELYRAYKTLSVSSFGRFKATGTYRWLYWLSIAVVAAFGVSCYTFLYKSDSFDGLSFLLILILFIVYTVLLRLITSEFARFVVYNSKRYTGPVKYKFDDVYLYVQDGGITSRFKWGSFYRVEDTKDFTLLYIDIHQAVIIPKKDEQAKEFAALLLERVRPSEGTGLRAHRT